MNKRIFNFSYFIEDVSKLHTLGNLMLRPKSFRDFGTAPNRFLKNTLIYKTLFFSILALSMLINTHYFNNKLVYADVLISDVTATARDYILPFEAYRAVDSTFVSGSWWESELDTSKEDPWIQLDLKKVYYIDRWLVANKCAVNEESDENFPESDNTKACSISYSLDGKTWKKADSVSNNKANTIDRTVTPFAARYVRLDVSAGDQAGDKQALIVEFQVYSVAIVSSVTVPSNGTYKLGKNLDFTVNFTDNITVEGTDSTLSLNIGSEIKQAAFLSKTANSITYRYTVNGSDLDTNGISVGAINLNKTAIKDAASSSVDAKLNNIQSTAGILVNGAAAPAVITGAAEDITTSAATLKGTINANYSDTSIKFQYGTSTSYGNEVTVTDKVKGGSVTSVSTVISGLKLGTTYHYRIVATNSIGTTYGEDKTFIAINTPLTTSVSVPGQGCYGAGKNLDFTVNFDSVVKVTGTPKLLLTIGGVQKTASYISGSDTSLTFRYTVASGDKGTLSLADNNISLQAGESIKDSTGTVDANCALNSIGTLSNIVIEYDNTLIYRESQKKLNSDGTYDILFLATIDTLDVDEVGFIFSKSKQVPIKGQVKDSNIKSTTKVYNSVNAMDTNITAASKGGKYIIACTVTEIPKAEADKPLYARAFVTKGGETKYTEAYTVTAKGN